jgi:hypothetical protein
MSSVRVSIGDQVFPAEGADAFGAVRHVRAHELVVNIEGAGDMLVPATAVTASHDGKVIVDVGRLPGEVQRAIARARALERP